jgi:hypothetical protein
MNGYQTLSALDNPVKNGTITNGHYYILYNNCDEDLICEFEEKTGFRYYTKTAWVNLM